MASIPKQSKIQDERLHFEPFHQWQKDKPSLLGTDYAIIRPNNTITDQPNVIEFDFSSPKSIVAGPCTKLIVRGAFQVKPQASEGVKGTLWRKCQKDDASNVCLAPLWFEQIIKEYTLFSQNTKISSFQEARFVTPYLNMLLYRLMDKTMKKIIAPQDTSPIYCLPDWNKDSWDVENKTHKDYVQNLFEKTLVEFDYTPLLMWPFHQNATGFSKILPLQLFPKLTLRIAFQDNQNTIFRRKTATDVSEYKFTFTECYLMLEEARLTPAFERNLVTSKRNLSWQGCTRLQLIEPISTGLSTYKTRFQNIFLPESLLIFAISKDVASGTYDFSKSTNKSFFNSHNIQSLQLSFQQKQFYIREPCPTHITDDRFNTKNYLDHLFHPICGVPADIESIKEQYFNDGAKNTSYPHVYVNLVNFGSSSRIIPALSDDSILNTRSDLEIEMKFNTNGSAADSSYIIYAIYNDTSITYDPKFKMFANPYLSIFN